MTSRYPKEKLHEDEDDGTIVENVEELEQLLVGRRIVSAEKGSAFVPRTKSPYGNWYTGGREEQGFIITLDNGERVLLEDNGDCCAYTALDAFLLHPDRVDHVITGVGTTNEYQTWHIFADMGDVLELQVGWSCGNPFYYSYGFNINVIPLDVEMVDHALEAA